MIQTQLPPEAEMVAAVMNRDRAYEGIFLTAVRTTGVFCKPTCPARKPRRENIEFFGSTREALAAGYRPCLRCRPMDTSGGVPSWLAGLLADVERDPRRRWTDADLLARALDPARVRRWFKTRHGMTFHAYQRARRLGLALGSIQRGADLDQTALRHGYESQSGFRDAFAHLFGDPPGKSRDARCLFVARIASPLGALIAGAVDEGVCLLEFADRRMLETQLRRLRKHLGCASAPGSHPHLRLLEGELAAYFRGELTSWSVPLCAPGTPFQRSVWRELEEIPYGQTRSYEELARAVGRPGAQRAVGRANGDNRIAIVIPCHRVVRSNGELCGYGGGVWRKRALLELERAHAPADACASS